MKKELSSKHITKIVNSYPTKYKEGFISKEINSLIKEYGLDSEKFYTSLGINTCMIKDGEIITYHSDIETALRCLVENRNKLLGEWD